MTPQCHGEWLLWRAAEGLPYPGDGDHAAAAEELAEEYAEEITPTQPERANDMMSDARTEQRNP